MTDAATRLRAWAIGFIDDRYTWECADDVLPDVLAALSECDPDAWVHWSTVTDAAEGQWFLWKSTDDHTAITADQVGAENGEIFGKARCGLDFFPYCQPVRWPSDVAAIVAKRAG